MEKRSLEYYKTHTILLVKDTFPSRGLALADEIEQGLLTAIIERKNVVLKPEYQNAIYLHGYTCYHPTIGHGMIETSGVVGLRLEDVIETNGEKVTHIYFKTRNREYLLHDEECFEAPIKRRFKKYKHSIKSFVDFAHLFDEVNDEIPEIQVIK